MSGRKDCPSCGFTNSGDAMFCSKCGGRLPAKTAAPKAPAEPVKRRPTPQPEPKKRRVAGAAKTMLGMPASDRPPKPETKEDVPSIPKAATVPAEADRALTMVGVPAPDANEIREAVRQAKANVAADKNTPRSEPQQPEDTPEPRRPKATAMAGLGGDVEAAIRAAAAAAPDVPDTPGVAPTTTTEPPPEPKPPLETNATQAETPKTKSVRPRAAAIGPSNRTMLGQPAPKPGIDYDPRTKDEEPDARSPDAPDAQSPDAPSRGRAPVVYPSTSGEMDAMTMSKPKRGGGVPTWLLVVGVLLFAVAGVLVAFAIFGGGATDLRASVVQEDGAELLEIEVPAAPAGTKLRFHGEERPLEAGRARFPIAADDLEIGDNELAVDVVDPDGEVHTEPISLHLAYRVRADLGPLELREAAIDVVVEAVPGSTVALNGEELELDAQGRATRRFPLARSEESAEGVVEHIVRYRVQPPQGQSEQGELRTRVQLTTMRIDRPGPNVVTDAASVQVAGAVAPGATVTVNDREVEVREDRFLTTHPLPAPGEHTIEIVARAPGKAPRIARIVVRRVASLIEEAASFNADPALTYGVIMQNPTTYRGQRVEFVGQVYNVDVANGTTTLQVQIDDCPARICPLWVSYPAATDMAVQSRVRVLGTVAGEQAFRSPSGQIRTVPRVDATFVLPAPRR
jgi:hypothetical protein